MAFKPRAQKTFIKYKDGKFYNTKDKALENPLGDFEGRIVDINLKMETIEGKPVEKMNIDLDGGDGIYGLSLVFESSLVSKLIGFLKSVDLTQTLTLSPAYKKEGEKEIRTIFVKEGTTEGAPFAKQYYTKDDPKGLPAMKKLKSGKWDKEDFSEFYRNVVLNELRPIVLGNKNNPESVEVPVVEGTEEAVDSEKLPF